MKEQTEKIVMGAFADATISLSCIFALRDVLLQSQEQKDLYNKKQKEYVEKLFKEFSELYNLDNAEEWLEQLKRA